MKITKLFSGLFAALGVIIMLVTAVVSLSSLNRMPQLLTPPEAALAQSEAVMEAVAQGDYTAAGNRMYGQPSLGVDRDPADAVGVLIWDAFVDSFTYEFTGDCYATDSGLARNVTITTLDISSVTANLKARSEALLEQRVAEAEDVTEIYDQDNNYREEFVMQVLYDATVQALQEDAAYTTQELTVNLVYQQEQWWVMPEQPLLRAISGGIAG